MRAKVGTIALLLIALALVAAIWPESIVNATWAGAFIRMGLVMAAVWLALPQLHNVPPWLIIAAGCIFVVLARWPRYFLLAAAIGVLLLLIRPRSSVRPRG